MNRTGTLPRKETLRLVASLQEQGCHIRHMKKGYRVEFPNGGSTMIHLTNSDSRGTMNTRAKIKRAGLIYPGDEPQHETRSKNMGKVLNDDQDAALRRVLNRIKAEGKFYAPVLDMARDAGVSGHTLNRRLHAIGWETRGAGAGLVWYAPGAAPALHPAPEYPEIERAKALVHPGARGHERLSFPRDDEKKVEPNGKSAWPQLTVPDIRPSEADRKVDEMLQRLSEKTPEREFIDSAESWTVDVPEKLRRTAEQLGLNIEVRVWR